MDARVEVALSQFEKIAERSSRCKYQLRKSIERVQNAKILLVLRLAAVGAYHVVDSRLLCDV